MIIRDTHGQNTRPTKTKWLPICTAFCAYVNYYPICFFVILYDYNRLFL